MIMVEIIIFDAGDVLVLRNENAFIRAAEQLQQEGWEGTIEEFKSISRNISDLLGKGGSDKEVQSILNKYNVPQILDYRDLEVQAFWNNLHPEAKEVLKGLKTQGIKLGVLTDSVLPENEVKNHLKTHDILKYIDTVVTSATLHHVKPEPEAYLEILGRFKATPNKNTAFVGHSEDELIGAKELGMLTIEYLPKSTGLANHHISRLLDLLMLCQHI